MTTAGWRNEDKATTAPHMAALIGGDTNVLVAYSGKASDLPAQWMHKRGAAYVNPYTGEPLTIGSVGTIDMVRIATNYPPEHALTVSPDTPLALWGGGVVRASNAKGKQLRGRYGMYVVQSIATVVTAAYKVNNASTVEGIFLW